jgi:hypothetical protein
VVNRLALSITLTGAMTLVGVVSAPWTAFAQNAESKKPELPVPVTVVSPLPLPVTGSVNLGAGSSVTVSNPATNPVPVVNVLEPAKEHFQFGVGSTYFDESMAYVVLEVGTVPDRKRLVIEHVSASVNAFLANGLAAVNLVVDQTNNVDAVPCVLMGKSGSGLNQYFSCASTTKFQATAGQKVVVVVQTGAGGGFARAFVSGYYEQVP